MPIQIGDVIEEKYRVVRLIGKGGMGSVYEGQHILVDRRVAIKVLLPALDRGRASARFAQEARAAGRIGNEHILDVYDMGSLSDGSCYLVAEYLDGETLRQRINRTGRLSPGVAIPLLLELLDGLGAAHAAGVVHRDLKPDNVFLVRKKAGRSDFVKLIDFGISRFEPLDASDAARMTTTGTVLGTPHYLSPEQARGRREIDRRSDLFAVGVILYEMVTGEVPFKAESFNDLLFKIVLEPAPAPEEVVHDLDPAFSRIMVKALAKDPAERYQSAEELGLALIRWATDSGLVLPDRATSLFPSQSEEPAARLATPATAASVPDASPRDSAKLAGLEPVPTPSAFGVSQRGQALRRRWTRTAWTGKAVAALAVAAIIGLVVAILLVRHTGTRIPENAGEPPRATVGSSELDAITVVPVLGAPSTPSPARAQGSASTPVSSAPLSAKPSHPQPVVPRRPAPAASSDASTPTSSSKSRRRRRDFGY
jgi:serine/threonine protein kinase